MIETKETLNDYIATLNSDFLGMDLEADNMHRYQEQLCLIQCTDGNKHQLIDPLAIEEIEQFKEKIASSEIWMHGADYDMSLMLKSWQILPKMLFDTQIAARLLGATSFGYGNLVENYLGVKLDKGMQKADWARRPLTEEMKQYALNDVIYLQPLAETLVNKLKEKKRYEWFEECCETALKKSSKRQQIKEDPWRIKGSGKLKPLALAYLRELWHWREREAEALDRPVFMVCNNKQLIEWVEDIAANKIPQLPKYFRSSRINRFIAAKNKVKYLKAEEMPQIIKISGREKNIEIEKRIDRVLKAKNQLAQDICIESGVICNRQTVENIMHGEAEAENVLMKWQYALMQPLLEKEQSH